MGRWVSTRRVRAAVRLQRQMAACFKDGPFPPAARFIGGADVAFCPPDDRCLSGRSGGMGCAAVAVAVVWDSHEERIVERRCAYRRVAFPYVPGLLSFREAPLLHAAMRLVRAPVDAWIFDGQGRSHPRGCGLATHMGLVANVVSIGAAKSLLCGEARPLADAAGSTAPVAYKGQVIAMALRGAPAAPPVYVSPGYRCTLEQALTLVRSCIRSGFLPEPTHQADALSKVLRTQTPAAARAYLRTLDLDGA